MTEKTASKKTEDPDGNHISKYAIIGIVVIQTPGTGKKEIGVEYLIAGRDGRLVDRFDLGRREDLLAVLQPPPNSYLVKRGDKVLGYEFGDATRPDWRQEV